MFTILKGINQKKALVYLLVYFITVSVLMFTLNSIFGNLVITVVLTSLIIQHSDQLMNKCLEKLKK